MANIHLIGGEKGGVGKLVVSRLLGQCRLHESSIMKIDAGSNSLWTATQPEDKGGVKLGILERQCVRSCLKCAYEPFLTWTLEL